MKMHKKRVKPDGFTLLSAFEKLVLGIKIACEDS